MSALLKRSRSRGIAAVQSRDAVEADCAGDSARYINIRVIRVIRG